MNPRQYTHGILLMLGANVSFAVMAASTKFCSTTVGVTEIIFIRSLIATVIFSIVLHQKRISMMGQNPSILIARGVVGFIAMWLYFWSVSKMPLGSAVMLNYTGPIFAVLYAALFFKEKPSSRVKALLALSFVGICLVAGPQFKSQPAPMLAALTSGCLVGVVHLLIRMGHKKESPLTIIYYFSFISTLGSMLFLVRTGFKWPSLTDYWGLLMVVVSSILGQLGLTYALRKAPVFVVSPFAYLTPVLSLFIGWFIWKETLPAIAIGGSVLVIFCGVLMYRCHAAEELKDF